MGYGSKGKSPVARVEGRSDRCSYTGSRSLKAAHRRSIADGRSHNEMESALVTGSTLDDPAALFRGAQLAGHPDGPRKGGLKKA